MNDNTSKCRKCGKPVYWQRSKNGKAYPCDSPDDRRDFHKCPAAEQPAKVESPTVVQPITPSYFEGSIEERLAILEKQVGRLASTVMQLQQRPIDDSDVGF